MITRTLALLVGLIVATSAGAQTPPAPLVLEAKIPLGSISGRIDHLAIDLKRKWLFVAELGNDSLGVVNLVAGKVLRTITGLREPQGVGYEPITDAVYVANASDGSVRILRGEDLAAVGRIDLGDDADNVRTDADRKRVLVGYGAGALAIIDPTTRTKVGDIRLKAHPESFQIDGDRVFVNVPDARLPILRRARSSELGRRSPTTRTFRWPSTGRPAGSSWSSAARRVSWSCQRMEVWLAASMRAAIPTTCSSIRSGIGST